MSSASESQRQFDGAQPGKAQAGKLDDDLAPVRRAAPRQKPCTRTIVGLLLINAWNLKAGIGARSASVVGIEKGADQLAAYLQ
jgi:hypothetical protein